MTIKDFKAGQEAFSIQSWRQVRQLNENDLIRCIVVKVGHKYVHVKPDSCPYLMQFYQDDEKDDFLTENRDWGDIDLLFPTKTAAFEYVEKRRIFDELNRLFRYPCGYERFTLEQLREVGKILNIDYDKE